MRQEWKDRHVQNASAFRYPEDVILYTIGILIYAVLYTIIKTFVSRMMIQNLAQKNIREVSERKFTRALWKGICFAAMFAWGVYCMYDQDWWCDPLGITLEWPHNRTPAKINAYYVLEVVYYTGSFITIFLEEKQSDFYLMLWHHFVTLVLVGFSYKYNFLRYGAFLMILHDVSDPWMEAAKISIYLGYQRAGDILFVIFTFMFIIPRIFVYSYMILIPGYSFLIEYNKVFLLPIALLLVGVFLLNLYWSVLILRMVYEFMHKGRVEKDIRDAETHHTAKDTNASNVARNSHTKPNKKMQ